MNKIHHIKSIRYLWLLLTFLFFNYSIDIPDLKSDSFSEDLSYNDIESFTELIIEKVIGFENAIPEHDDDDSDGFVLKIKKIDFLNNEPKPVLEKKELIKVFKTTNIFYNFSALLDPYLLVEVKPPQV